MGMGPMGMGGMPGMSGMGMGMGGMGGMGSQQQTPRPGDWMVRTSGEGQKFILPHMFVVKRPENEEIPIYKGC